MLQFQRNGKNVGGVGWGGGGAIYNDTLIIGFKDYNCFS